MKFWPRAFDSLPFHVAVQAALWAGEFAARRFLLPAQPWMPAEAAFAAPIDFAFWAAMFAYNALVMIYLLRVGMRLAPVPFPSGQPGKPPRPARSFDIVLTCIGLGLTCAFSVAVASIAVKMMLEPAVATLGDQAFPRYAFLASFVAVAPPAAVAAWLVYARSEGRSGALAA